MRKEARPLDSLARLRIQPDLVFTKTTQVVAVADTRYRLLDDNGRFPNADAYQLVTYCARLGLNVGHLIYAAGEPCPLPYDFLGTGSRLVVHAVDPTQAIADVEADARAISNEIVSAASTHLPGPRDLAFRVC